MTEMVALPRPLTQAIQEYCGLGNPHEFAELVGKKLVLDGAILNEMEMSHKFRTVAYITSVTEHESIYTDTDPVESLEFGLSILHIGAYKVIGLRFVQEGFKLDLHVTDTVGKFSAHSVEATLVL